MIYKSTVTSIGVKVLKAFYGCWKHTVSVWVIVYFRRNIGGSNCCSYDTERVVCYSQSAYTGLVDITEHMWYLPWKYWHLMRQTGGYSVLILLSVSAAVCAFFCLELLMLLQTPFIGRFSRWMWVSQFPLDTLSLPLLEENLYDYWNRFFCRPSALSQFCCTGANVDI